MAQLLTRLGCGGYPGLFRVVMGETPSTIFRRNT